MRNLLALLALGVALTACDHPPASPPIQAQRSALSKAELRALAEKGRADAERNSKITRPARRFTEDSL